MLNILILEDHPMMVESIKASIRSLAFQTRIFAANGFRDLQSGARFSEMGTPDLVVADLNVPDSAGLATVQRLRTLYPLAPILIFSQTDDDLFEDRALANGATAFVSKSRAPALFTQKLQMLLAGVAIKPPADDDAEMDTPAWVAARMKALTRQQTRVLSALASGLDAKQVALQLGLADQTIRAHLAEIYQRLGVRSRSQAVVIYLQWASHQDAA